MSPLGQSPNDHRGSQGDINGDCTYNKPTTSNTQSIVNTTAQINLPQNDNERRYTKLSVHVHNQTQQVTLVQKNSSRSPISFKERRNSEQRIPGKKTLKDFFPIIKNHSKFHSAEAILETPHHWLQRNKQQTTYKARAKRVITPTELSTPSRKLNTKQRNHLGTKTNRSILMEFDNEKTKKSTRQSRVYESSEWFQKNEHINTATQFHGHSMQQIDNTSTYRVLLQNTNGIDPSPTNHDFQFSLNTCFDQCISFLSLTETNTEWNNFKYREQLRDSLKKWWDGTTFQTSTSSILFSEKYKPGGTVSIVCGNHWVARVIEKGEDEAGLGRWTYVGLQGNQHTKILHITWYNLCKQGITTVGEKTAFHQQYTILREKFPDLDINPTRQSVLDMQLFITKKQREGYFVILSGDMNVNLSATKFGYCPLEGEGIHAFSKHHDGSVLTLVNTCGLVDILRLQHDSEQVTATYIRGKNRIDGIFVSHQIVHTVLRTGLTPFHTFFASSDHRAVYVDFSANLLFHSNTYELVRQKGRGLQLRDPRIVDAYILALFEQLDYHKVMKKLARLVQIAVEDWTERDRITYEKLDRVITESMIHAESTCAKRYSTKYHWSPLLLQAVYAYRYARLRLKEANNLPVTKKAITYHQKQAKITDEQHNEIKAIGQIVQFLREAKASMKEQQRKHAELRKEYVESLAEAMVFKKFPTIEKATGFFGEQKERQLKALSNRESARMMHSKIRTALKRTHGGGTIRVDVPDAAELFSPEGKPYGDPENPKEWKGPWSIITEPEEMERHIILANTKQYHQAHTTPFAQEPLASLFGPDGTTQFAQNFLAGTPMPPDIFNQLQPETQRILNALQAPASNTYDKEAVIRPSKFISCYKKLDEKISSSLSTRHVGHYKSILDKPSLVEMHCHMMTLPYRHGFSVERWTRAVDVVPPKDEGKHYIHRHRIIRLVESDYNQTLRILFARPLGFFFEDNEELPEMQYGSRAGQMSISAVFNKVLSFDLARLLKIVMATEENDAIGCYDRIMQQLVALYLLRMGILLAAITCVCRTFDETIHYIKTAHGIANKTYMATKEVPLYGAGQGTTGGPLFWLIIFSLLIEAFDPTMRGMTFRSPCKTIVSTRYGDAFVDDTKFGVTVEQPPGQQDPSEEQTQIQAQQVLSDLTRISQHYEKLLFGSGGALNIRKCHWILIAWKWKDGKATMMTSADCPGQLFLTSGYSEIPEEVPRLEPDTAYRTLGAYITVTGSMKHSLALNRRKSVEYAGLLSSSNLSRCEAYFSFVLYFYPKIRYALPISTFTQKECTFIQAPAMSALLPKMGLNRHTSKNIIHGPPQYGGLQLQEMYTDQGIGQLRLLIGHLRRGGETSRLLLIAISVMQQRVGSSVLFFNLPYPKYDGWIEATWLTSLWKFLHVTGVLIEMSEVPIPRAQRDNDFFLMSEFIYLGFKKGDLDLINQCRIYHQVLTAADIMVADGTRIDPAYKTPQRNFDRISGLQWPNQGCPSPKAWRQWNLAIQHLVHRGKLKDPLGKWTTRPHQEWSWLVRLEDKALFHKHSTGWERYDPIAKIGVTRRSQKPWYSMTQRRPSRRPERGIAVATPLAEEMDGDIFTIVWSEELPPPREDSAPAPTTVDSTSDSSSAEAVKIQEYLPIFKDKIQSSEYFKRLVGPIHNPKEEDILEIADRISEGTLLLCSDGSFCPSSGTGSHAWLFSTPEGEILLRGAGPIDCNPIALSSYRPELGGMTALLYVLMCITQLFGISSGSVIMFCDNKSALENILDETPKRGIYPLLEVDYDLLLLAKEILHSMPVTVVGKWVKGHYSGDNRQVEHDLNSLADTMATQFRENPPYGYHPTAFPLFHRSHKAAAYIGGSMITSKLVQQIYSQRYQKGLAETICKHNKWSPHLFQDIDWVIFGKVFRSYSRFYQISIAKYVHGLWNTGHQKVLYKQDAQGLCPCCNLTIETNHHIFQCTAPVMATHRTQQLQVFYDYLDEQELPKPVKQCIFSGIEGWFSSVEEKPVLYAPTRGKLMPAEQLATRAFTDQTAIGWQAFLRGQLSKSWRRAILLANPTRDEDATEQHLRRL